MAHCLPKFLEKNPYDALPGYTCTNEEPESFFQLLKGREVDRIGGIASGGEVLLACLLLKTKELVAVDHSCRSLCGLWSKILLIDSLGPEEAKKVLTGKWDTCIEAIEKIWDRIPQELRLKPTMLPRFAINASDFIDIAREWMLVKPIIVKAIARRLDRLTIIHGDLTDLEGQFDVLYLSNALEHQDRAGKCPVFLNLAPLLKDDGIVLVAGSEYSVGLYQSVVWREVKRISPKRTAWQHRVIKRFPQVHPASNLFVGPTAATGYLSISI